MFSVNSVAKILSEWSQSEFARLVVSSLRSIRRHDIFVYRESPARVGTLEQPPTDRFGMALLVECDICGNQHRVKDEWGGKSIRCKECGVPLSVSAENVISVGTYFEEDGLLRRREPKHPAVYGSRIVAASVFVLIAMILFIMVCGLMFVWRFGLNDLLHSRP